MEGDALVLVRGTVVATENKEYKMYEGLMKEMMDKLPLGEHD